jgi:choline dehydrogenase
MYGGAAVLMTPQSRGTVKIASSNPFDKPLIDLGFLTHPFDILALKEGVRTMKRFYAHSAWSNFTATNVSPDPDAMGEGEWEGFTRSVGGSTLHAVGTCSMSKKGASTGVVDPNLKVKGLKGLRIVDGSVIVSTTHRPV